MSDELQRIFEGLCEDLGHDSQSSPEAERIWEALRAASGLFQFSSLVKSADHLSKVVIANEVRPGFGLSHEVWNAALCVREELKLVEMPVMRPLTFHYTMRDALWNIDGRSL